MSDAVQLNEDAQARPSSRSQVEIAYPFEDEVFFRLPAPRTPMVRIAVLSPALAAAREGDAFLLTLSFNEDRLPFPTAAALLDAIAARVENPIRQLL